jgi:hypothetical protein
MTLPKATVNHAASQSALPLLAIGLLGALAQAGLILLWARSLFVNPLERLVRDAAGTPDRESVSDPLEARSDEIGEPGRSPPSGPAPRRLRPGLRIGCANAPPNSIAPTRPSRPSSPR